MSLVVCDREPEQYWFKQDGNIFHYHRKVALNCMSLMTSQSPHSSQQEGERERTILPSEVYDLEMSHTSFAYISWAKI